MISYQEIRAEYEKKTAALRQEMIALGEQFFASESKKIFDEFPELESFSWRQYTPYFNDGDECVFRVYADWGIEVVLSTGEVFDELSPYRDTIYVHVDGRYQSRPNPNKERTLENKLHDAIVPFISSIDDETMKYMFGDHCKVTVNRNGTVDVDDYEHE